MVARIDAWTELRKSELETQQVLFGTVAAAAMNAFGRKIPVTWRDFFTTEQQRPGRRVLSADEMRDQFKLAHSMIGTN